jgi:hypothetical protein
MNLNMPRLIIYLYARNEMPGAHSLSRHMPPLRENDVRPVSTVNTVFCCIPAVI